MGYTEAQLKVLGYLQKTSGSVSTICSLYLIYIVLTDPKKRCKPYHRLVAGISCFDAVGSFAMFLSTWPIPVESGLLWASGNELTCNIQAYFAQFIIGSAMYNTCLSIYYFLVIIHGWSDDKIKTIEPYLHAAPFILTISTATAGLILDLYGNAFFWCWIRGDQNNYRWGFFYIPNWTMIFAITYVCARVWWHVRKVEQQIEKYNPTRSLMLSQSQPARAPGAAAQHGSSASIDMSGSIRFQVDGTTTTDNNSSTADGIPEQPEPKKAAGRTLWIQQVSNRSSWFKPTAEEAKADLARRRKQHWRTRLVARQCFLYAAAFYFTWMGATLNRVLNVILNETYYGILVMTAFMTPILGLPNFIVYLLPKFRHIRKHNPNSGWYQWIKRTLLKGNEIDETTLDCDATSMAIKAPTSTPTAQASGVSAELSIHVIDENEEDEGEDGEAVVGHA